jgi:hypothetical protein
MIDIEELKKLPTAEKWRIIDELEASMSEEDELALEPEPRLLKEMEQRVEDLRSGKNTGYTWEEAEAIWRQTLLNKPKLTLDASSTHP